MAISPRQKLTIIPLLLYWPTIFILAHIPIPQLVRQAHVSDKSLHFLAYLILVFLLWFAISPNKKVNWRRTAVWWVLFVVSGYGVVDEWLQCYVVGRSGNIADFSANLAGTLTGLILLSFFTFLPVLLIVTGITIFLLTNLARANVADLLPVTSAVFHPFAYGFFTIVWIRNMYRSLPQKAPKPKWLMAALAMPAGLLLLVKLFSVISGRYFGVRDVILSAVGIAAVVAAIFLTALLRRRFAQRLSSSNT